MTIVVKKIASEGAEEKLDVALVLNEPTAIAIAEFEATSLTVQEQAIVTAFIDLVKAKAV